MGLKYEPSSDPQVVMLGSDADVEEGPLRCGLLPTLAHDNVRATTGDEGGGRALRPVQSCDMHT